RALRAGALPDRAARARRLRPRRHARSARALGAARPRRPPSRHPPRGKLSRWGPSVFSYFFSFRRGAVRSVRASPEPPTAARLLWFVRRAAHGHPAEPETYKLAVGRVG